MRKFFNYTDKILPVHHPRVVVETAVMLGAPREALFENSELTSQMLTTPEMRVSYLQYGILCSNALRLTRNPALGLHVGRNTGIAQMGVLGFVYMNSPTIGAAFNELVRYGHAILPAWDFSLERGKETAVMTVTEAIPLAPFSVLAHEIVLAAIDKQARTLNGDKALPIVSAEFPYPRPEHAGLYKTLLYDVPMRFDRPVAKIEFEAWLLDERLPFADPATLKLAEQFCARLLPADPSHEGLVAQVRRVLAAELQAPPSLQDIARTLQTSPRTLRRELQKMRTSYKQLIDESRKARAEAWMETNSLPVERLAKNLGFSTVGSFRRAFKRWTGRTPGAARTRERAQ